MTLIGESNQRACLFQLIRLNSIVGCNGNNVEKISCTNREMRRLRHNQFQHYYAASSLYRVAQKLARLNIIKC